MIEGRHVKVLFRGEAALLGDAEHVREFVELLVERLGMRQLTEPVVVDVPLQVRKLGAVPFEDEGGVTAQVHGVRRLLRGALARLAGSWIAGVVAQEPLFAGSVVLSTSHVAIHTWPLRERAVLDAYSCRDFDPELVRELVEGWFGARAVFVRDLSFALDDAEGA